MNTASPTSVVGILALAVLVITVAYSIPSLKIVAHELWTWRRNRSEP
jgi:hypothetical protein